MKKAAQILATYFGDRRHYPHNKDGVVELINKQVEWHKTLDLGYPTDLIIVNHDIELNGVQEFLNEFDGTATYNGIVRILHRPFFEADISYASYKYAFFKYKDEYEYWYFNEDDVLIQHISLIKDMIDLLDSDPTLGFIAASNFIKHRVHLFTYDADGYIIGTGDHVPHAHGGCGLTSTKILSEICTKYPDFMNTANIRHEVFGESIEKKTPGGYMEGEYEIDFTYRFIQAGYKMKCISNGSSFLRLQDGASL